jgi:tyrosinase
MAPLTVRRNAYGMSTTDWNRFVTAVKKLKTNGTYDAWTRRHQQAITDLTLYPGETGTSRNAAHRGPSFGPWHRVALRQLELQLQAVDGGTTPLGIPYWAWDAEVTTWRTARIWSMIGGDGDPAQRWRVTTGPFAAWNSVIWNASTKKFVTRAGILRQFGADGLVGPAGAMQIAHYDIAPWNEASDRALSFRCELEGDHDYTHIQIGGDMLAGTAPNDPVFWLHHANIDRLWATWQTSKGVTNYQPTSGGPPAHNLNDRMRDLPSGTWTPAGQLDWRLGGFTYDVLG